MGIQSVRVTAFVSLTLLTPSFSFSQSPVNGEVRFKVQADTVIVDVVVTDSKGNIIPGLTVNDFKVSENGVQQKIVSFEPPTGVGAKGSVVAPSTGTTAMNTGQRLPGNIHLITLVLDLSDMRAAGLTKSIKAATDYVQKSVNPDDFVALYTISGSLRLVVPYTRDRARLTAGLQSAAKFSNQGIYTSRDKERVMSEVSQLQTQVAQLQSTGDISSRAMAEMANIERLTMIAEIGFQSTFQAKEIFKSLRAIAVSAGTLPGRKNVVLFSEGFLHSDDADNAMQSVISAANRSNVAFYVVDPSGTEASRNNIAGGQSAENATDFAVGAEGGRRPNTAASRQAEFARMGPQVNGGRTKFDLAKTNMALEAGPTDMKDIAEATGGFVVKSNSPAFSLDKIDRDLREHYTISYQPSEAVFDGKLRTIKVEVEGKGHRARYRNKYWALAPGDDARLTPAAAQMVASITNGTAKPTIATRLNAALVFESREDHALPFSVWLPNDTSWLVKDSAGGYESKMTVVVTARNAQGRLVDAYQQFINFQATKEQWKSYEKRGLQLMGSLSMPTLEPVDLQAIVQFSSDKWALSAAKVGIPGVTDSGVRPTSLLLTPQVEMAKNDQPAVIPALRIAEYDVILPKDAQFNQGAKMTLYFGLADVAIDASSGRPLIGLAVAIKNGTKVVRELQALDGLYPWPQSKSRLFFLKQFDLAGLAPGAYTIEATVRDRAKNTTQVQTAPFSIQ